MSPVGIVVNLVAVQIRVSAVDRGLGMFPVGIVVNLLPVR